MRWKIAASVMALIVGLASLWWSQVRYNEGVATRYEPVAARSNFAIASNGFGTFRSCQMWATYTYDKEIGITKVNLHANLSFSSFDRAGPQLERSIGLVLGGDLTAREKDSTPSEGNSSSSVETKKGYTLEGNYVLQGRNDPPVGDFIGDYIRFSSGEENSQLFFRSDWASGSFSSSKNQNGDDFVSMIVELSQMRGNLSLQRGPRLTMALPQFLGSADEGGQGAVSCAGSSTQEDRGDPRFAEAKVIDSSAPTGETVRSSRGNPYADDQIKQPVLNPEYRLDISTPPPFDNGSLLLWRGTDATSPVASIVNRAGEIDAQNSLFAAAIGYGLASALLLLAFQVFPWTSVLPQSKNNPEEAQRYEQISILLKSTEARATRAEESLAQITEYLSTLQKPRREDADEAGFDRAVTNASTKENPQSDKVGKPIRDNQDSSGEEPGPSPTPTRDE